MHNPDRESTPPAEAARPDVLVHVAGNVRRLRQAANISQARLATLSGLSRRMIVGLESGDANISLTSLDRVAMALGVSFAEIVRPPDAADSRRIGGLMWRGAAPGSAAILLGSVPASHEAELWLWTLGEGERYTAEGDGAGWHEMLYVIAGALTVEFTDARRCVTTGDYLIYSSAQPYAFVNTGTGVARFVRNVVF